MTNEKSPLLRIADIIEGYWGVDPAYYTSSQNNDEAEHAKQDCAILEYIFGLKDKNGIRNCPVCGGKACHKSVKYNTLGTYGGSDTEKRWHAIYCTSCGVSQPALKYENKKEAVDAWNGGL